MIKEIAFTAYRVTDMARAREFYEKFLGLNVTTNHGGQWIEYEIGGGTFVIQTFTPEPPEGQRGLVAFEVDDFDATIASLKTSGIALETEPYDTSMCRFASLKDPDGNPVLIHKLKSS